jgi:hypothetical protein
MERPTGVSQRELRRITCRWGPHAERHAALVPFFGKDYRVFGMLGISLGRMPVWYPGAPVSVSPGQLRYKDVLTERPPALATLEPGLFRGAYYLDPWRMLGGMMAMLEGAPGLDQAVNLAGRRLQGRPLLDVVYEPPLHRVRAFIVKRGWLGSERRSVLRMPALAEALDPLPRTVRGPMAPAGLGQEGGTALKRAARDMLEPGLPEEEAPLEPGPGPEPAAPERTPRSSSRQEGFLARMVRRAIESGMEEDSRR